MGFDELGWWTSKWNKTAVIFVTVVLTAEQRAVRGNLYPKRV